jgi:hypothetical protein
VRPVPLVAEQWVLLPLSLLGVLDQGILVGVEILDLALHQSCLIFLSCFS